MLKKNKDYVEFTLQYTSVDWERRSKDCPEVCLKGYSDFSFPGVPIMDVVCNEFDHKVVVVSKRDFEKMQADVNINAEIAKQWEINYDLLLKKIGFDTVEELVNYLDSEAECDTLREAIASLEYSVKFARDERRDLSKKLDECEKDYISERDKAEKFQTENKQLKKKLHEFDPIPDFKELFKKLYSIEDTESLEWALNHTCGGRGSVNGWRAVSSFWSENYKTLSKLVGFSSTEEIQDYLTNEAECDTLQEAISKLKDQVKYTCDEWYSANSSNNSWKAAAECNSPKELIEKRETIEKEIQVYSRALQEWKEITGYPSPSAVKTALESGASWCHAYNEIKKANEKLADGVKSWKNVTGYSTPEDYMHARISGAFHIPFDYTAAWRKATSCDTPCQVKSRIEGLENAIRLTNKNMLSELDSEIKEWQKATGCNTPEQAKERIKALNERIDESEADYNHLLCTTGFESEGEIEDALDKCDHSTLRKALVDYEFDYEELLKLTGYKSNQDIRVALNDSEQFVYKDMRELINSLKRKAKFTESNWQGVTGFSTPEKCSLYIDRLEKKLEDIKNLAEED